MRFDTLNNQSTPRRAAGFTLVELLVVIVIVAILVAILFPVVKKVLETSRQATSISNMHQIQQALVKYQQDHDGHSPSVLFGYADSTIVPFPSMQSAFGAAQSAGLASKDFPGLYPTYVKDVSTFIDPNNPDSPTDANATTAVQTVTVNQLSTGGVFSANTGSASLYTADSYDSSPIVTSTGGLNTASYSAWYQTYRAALGGTELQLCLPNPNGATFVTATTYHADKNGNILLLFEDGTVRTLASYSFYNAQAAPYVLKPTSN